MSEEHPHEGDFEIRLKPIGTARTPYRDAKKAPFQGRFASELAVLEIDDDYAAGLKNVETANALYVLYWAHLAARGTLQTATPWGPQAHGVFACRSPSRPNPINLCVVELVERHGNRLTVRGLDALDGSRILDIKPYSADFDSFPDARIGWFDEQTRTPE